MLASEKNHKKSKGEGKNKCEEVMMKHHYEIENNCIKNTVEQMDVIDDEDVQRKTRSLEVIEVIDNIKLHINM